MSEKSSLLYWYPKIKDLNIPVPETEIIVLDKQHHDLMPVCDGDFSPIESNWNEIVEKARKIGFPLFMRTDEFSGKHNWKNTCYVRHEEDLRKHIANLFDDSFMADMMGLPLRAIVLRKYIQMDNLFNAFYGEMPVNPEMRFFVKDGEILCSHFYWVTDAIEQGTDKDKLPVDWKELIIEEENNIYRLSDIDLLVDYAEKVAKQFEGCWSVDFCKAKDGEWILIDLAEAHLSWHPEDCENEKIIRYEGKTK